MPKFRKMSGGKNAKREETESPPVRMEEIPMLMDVDTLARTLAISPGAVRAMHKRGEILKEAIVHVGRRLRFHPAGVRKWLDRLAKDEWNRAVGL